MGCSSSKTAAVEKDNIVTDINNIFEFIKTLGEGASCDVQECIEKGTSTKVALKRMQKTKQNHQLFEKEVEILRDIKHPNILKYQNCFMDSQHYYIVTRLCQGGELFDRIIQNSKFTEKYASTLVKQMLLAIDYLHSRDIVHRDLKPENFVFESKDGDSTLILIDFGCAMKVIDKKEYKEIVGTPYYLAPEYLKPTPPRRGITLKSSDMWAIGVICFILVTGQPPFNGRTNKRIFQNILQQKLKFPKRTALSDILKEFITVLLNKDPKKRPNAKEMLEHPFITGKGVDLSSKEMNKELITLLGQFKSESKLKKKLSALVSNRLSNDNDTENIKKIFESVDQDNDKFLTADELAQVLIKTNNYYKNDALKKAEELIEICDDNGDKRISFEEFIRVYASIKLSSDDKLIHTMFSILDENGDGSLELQELKHVLHLSDTEAKQMFEEADLDGDGTISFNEFKQAMGSNLKNGKIAKNDLVAGFGNDHGPLISPIK